MICEKCKKKEANYHSTLIINGVSESIHLCEDCARREGKLGAKSTDIFEEFFNSFNDAFSKDIFDGFFCPSCSTSFTSFKNNGYLGCENCFDVFKHDIDDLFNFFTPKFKKSLPKIKDEKIEFNTPKKSKEEIEIENLQQKLALAIKEERYEDASDYNKQIKNLKEKLKNNK